MTKYVDKGLDKLQLFALHHLPLPQTTCMDSETCANKPVPTTATPLLIGPILLSILASTLLSTAVSPPTLSFVTGNQTTSVNINNYGHPGLCNKYKVS